MQSCKLAPFQAHKSQEVSKLTLFWGNIANEALSKHSTGQNNESKWETCKHCATSKYLPQETWTSLALPMEQLRLHNHFHTSQHLFALRIEHDVIRFLYETQVSYALTISSFTRVHIYLPHASPAAPAEVPDPPMRCRVSSGITWRTPGCSAQFNLMERKFGKIDYTSWF